MINLLIGYNDIYIKKTFQVVNIRKRSLVKNIKSLGYIVWERTKMLLGPFIKEKGAFINQLEYSPAKNLFNNAKQKEDKGSPCLIPSPLFTRK